MTNNNIALIKQLRERTGAGFMECKEALISADSNIDKAIKHLQERGIIKAANKSTRTTKEGHISIAQNEHAHIILELSCETDFVAKNETFQSAAQGFAQTLLTDSLENTKALSPEVQQALQDLILRLGENIQIKRFEKILHKANHSTHSYLHQGAKIGVLVQFTHQEEATVKNTAYQSCTKDIAMHIAAMSPRVLTEADYPAEALREQKQLFQKQIKESGEAERIFERLTKGKNLEASSIKNLQQALQKILDGSVSDEHPAPETHDPLIQELHKILERILTGKTQQFFKETVLLKQPFIKNDKNTIQKHLSLVSQECHDKVSLARFLRYQVGEHTQ